MDLTQDYFELFGLSQDPAIDRQQLSQRYRQLQRQFHPDQYARKSHSEQRLAEQFSAYINTAYQTLSSSVLRADYLLQLAGQTLDRDNMTIADAAFLMKQLQWREQLAAIAEGKSVEQPADGLSALETEVVAEAEALASCFTQCYQQRDFSQAIDVVAKWYFVDKMQNDIACLEERLLD
ncbi:MAG: Fe-S protein assembly co-chaperone HscB [Cellvibrionaceae bacterium]|nr:Fe-S protein assembly co-chaperone HscB [Cellvibrionaceae bacterium]